jgi:hypothetical protein
MYVKWLAFIKAKGYNRSFGDSVTILGLDSMSVDYKIIDVFNFNLVYITFKAPYDLAAPVNLHQNTSGTGGPHTANASGPACTWATGVSLFTRSPSA